VVVWADSGGAADAVIVNARPTIRTASLMRDLLGPSGFGLKKRLLRFSPEDITRLRRGRRADAARGPAPRGGDASGYPVDDWWTVGGQLFP
jgi:hypothetical protein